MKNFFLAVVILVVAGCQKVDDKKLKNEVAQFLPVNLDLEEANRLVSLPMNCVNVEFPNKLGQTIGGIQDLKSPKELHPAFYGCFDWHSSVHGHWSLVSLLKQFPTIENAPEIKKILAENISKEHILIEVDYFNGKHNKSYERTYGWAWLLKLAEELHTWDDEIARELEKNLQHCRFFFKFLQQHVV